MGRPTVIVGLGTCGIAAGGQEVYDAIAAELKRRGVGADLVSVGCIGMCEQEVLVDVVQKGAPRITYARVTPDMVPRLVEQHVAGGQPIGEWVAGTIIDEFNPYLDVDFYKKQKRIVLKNCGIIDPEKIEEYFDRDGYRAMAKVLATMKPAEVIDEVKKSGLRGRGGAGFLTGLKWEFAAKAAGSKKYIICNADEGDPGAFMDRSVLEGDPHAVIEGMIIGAYAIGADEGYIYCRAEYPLAIKRLELAIEQATERGLMGPHVLGTDYRFELHIKEGAGAFVCGEETALMASIEGERGMPRPRPPFPANRGLFGRPTNINNVETWANVPQIILNGSGWYAGIGTEKSKGTKVFALTGRIKNTGLAEVPMGITLREIIYDVGGGIKDDKEFKAVQIGGPSGGCIPAKLMDTPVDYESLAATGAIMGSGGLVVVDETTCMVDFNKFFLNFTQSESCGKCTPCREGTKRMYEIVTRITEGKSQVEDLDKLAELAQMVKETSLCALGQTAPNPVLTTLKYFRDEYLAHIVDKKCPAHVCKALIKYRIDADKCKACLICKRSCAQQAISGEKKIAHVIDQAKCTQCGTCEQVCPFGAVIRE
ncbi:MAG TPA: NADH-quinone oxidoreductase subunit NuoF [Bacillota bacterium]